jgi:hypothetical protein
MLYMDMEIVLLYYKWVMYITMVLTLLVCKCVCVLVGLYSCCIFKYEFIVYMVCSIISCGLCFKYFICEKYVFHSVRCVIYIMNTGAGWWWFTQLILGRRTTKLHRSLKQLVQ